MLKLFRKGQSTAEYAIVIGLVIAAAVAMQTYVKRSMQGKMKDAIDMNEPEATYLGSGQYEPDYLSYDNTGLTSQRDLTEKATTNEGGDVIREIQGEEYNSRTGTTHTKAAPNN